MNPARIAALGLVLACVAHGARAQPGQVLKDTVRELIAAGNYTWHQTNETDTNGRRHGDKSWGATIVDGSTVANVGGFNAVFHGYDCIFELKSGWRHAHDFTPQEIEEVSRVPNLVRPGPNGKTARLFEFHAPHELLRVLINAAGTVWEQDGAIRAEVPWLFEQYAARGALPSGSNVRSVLGVPRRTTSPPRPTGTRPGEGTGTLSVWLQNGRVTKFSVEFARTFTAPSGSKQGDLVAITRTSTVEVSKVGSTKVDVASEARALVRNQPAPSP